MDLKEIFNQFKEIAKPLGDYTTISINELADKYCEATDNKDEETRNMYFCALVLRFWFRISKLYNGNKSLNLDYADYYNWIVDAIEMSCAKGARAWQTNKKLNAQQVINQTLTTRFVAAAYYESNLKKNQGKLNTTSLDEPLGDEEDGNTVADIIPSEELDYEDNGNVYSLIQDYINNNKLVEAIILDNIAFKDSCKQEKSIVKSVNSEGQEVKYTEYYSTFWPYKVVKELSALTPTYQDYFKSTYEVSEPALKAAISAIDKANNQKKHKYLEATLNLLRADFGASGAI